MAIFQTTEELGAIRQALACFASEIPHEAAQKEGGYAGRSQLYWRARAVVVHDRALCIFDGTTTQPRRKANEHDQQP
jgi:hypothetical protein